MTGHPPHSKQFTATIEREDDSYVALCPNLIEEARRNLLEAVELRSRIGFTPELYVTQFALAVG